MVDFISITMGLLEAIGFLALIYGIFQVTCWTLLDCDIELFLAHKFGRKLSKMKGKVVWITGASSGIGRELAKCLSKHGAKLVLSGRRECFFLNFNECWQSK
jgi:dehydrogenase/reductase SDR family member 7